MARAKGGEASIVGVAVHMNSYLFGKTSARAMWLLDLFADHTDRLRGEVTFGFGKSI